MKIILITILTMLMTGCSYTQRNIVRFAYRYQADIWKPYSEPGVVYQDINRSISSDTWHLNLQTHVIDKPKWGINVGVTYKKINYRVIDHLNFWNYEIQSSASPPPGEPWGVDQYQRIFSDPADLVATSKSYGIILEEYYTLFQKEKIKGVIGLNTEVYLLEYYNAVYVSSDFTSSNSPEKTPQASQGPRKSFFLSSINSSIFYRITWSFAERINLGLKVSVGANIYSDWEQFKRYAWLGVGLELGFLGKKKE